MKTFNTQFNLSRDYLAECFDQSLPYGKNAKPNYLFPALMFVAGAGLLFFVEQYKTAGGVFIALAVLELFHIKFRRTWWLTRQMWGRSADIEVKLTIDDERVQTETSNAQTVFLWVNLERVIETDLGLILVEKSGGQQYLSKSLFSPELINEIVARN